MIRPYLSLRNFFCGSLAIAVIASGRVRRAKKRILGSNMVFNNGGGEVTPVYGTSLQIDVVNVGAAPISCNQLMVYAVVH